MVCFNLLGNVLFVFGAVIGALIFMIRFLIALNERLKSSTRLTAADILKYVTLVLLLIALAIRN